LIDVSVEREQKGTPDKVSKSGTHLIPQIDISVERGQKGTPDKVSKSGNFSTLKKLPGME
jgi:hypothetical protein